MSKVTFSSIPQMKAAVSNSGSYFFSAGAMRFFRSKVEGGIIGGHYFITSEQFDDESPRLFTVRYFSQGEAHERMESEELGEFQQFASRKDARAFLDAHIRAEGISGE